MTGVRPAALARAPAEWNRSMVPMLAMSSADNTAPIPGSEGMSSGSKSRSMRTIASHACRASAASSRTMPAKLASPGTAALALGGF